MSEHPPGAGYVGRSVLRREDPRLLRGEGLFVGDVQLPNMAYAAFLRSPFSHARITRLDLSRAQAMPGVLAVISCADLGAIGRLPTVSSSPALQVRTGLPLAADRVLYVGEAVAAVVAEDAYLAEDALELVDVDYEELPAVADIEDALNSNSPLVHTDMTSNLAAMLERTVGDPDRAFARADLVLRHDFRFARASSQPMETRGVVASYQRERGGDHFTMWSSTQVPHFARHSLATLMGLPDHAVRVVAPDVGGGFGPKAEFYAEELVVPFLARLVDRPVRWIEDRRENLITSYHEREQSHHLEIGALSDGTLVALRDHYVVDMGAYAPHGLVVAFNPATSLSGAYNLRNLQVEMRAVYTNRVPIAPYRGAGRPPGVYAIEHAIELVARELHLDPVEVRRRNLLQPEQFPYHLGLLDRDGNEIVFDSGDYPACMDQAVALIDVDAFRDEQRAALSEGRHLGLGFGCYVESTGRGPYEGATVRVEPNGKVLVFTGAAPQGQAHETTLAPLCADRLGVSIEDVTVVTGDTETIGMGVGTFASRTAVVAGNAVSMAAITVRDKALEVAGQLLEAAPHDLEIHQGAISVRGVPDRRLTLAEVARVVTAPPPAFTFPVGLEPGLESTHYFHAPSPTYANGVHAAVVEVDVETGVVDVLRYAVAHDCGTIINPIVVDGQVRGGVAQGIGNALYEESAFDEVGQPLATNLGAYLVPTAMEVPKIGLAHHVTPSPLNPEGIKGVGEGGTMPAPAVIANAIEDALKPIGNIVIEHIPITPPRLLELINRARESPEQHHGA